MVGIYVDPQHVLRSQVNLLQKGVYVGFGVVQQFMAMAVQKPFLDFIGKLVELEYKRKLFRFIGRICENSLSLEW